MLVPGAMAAISPAMVIITPAEAARAPLGTHRPPPAQAGVHRLDDHGASIQRTAGGDLFFFGIAVAGWAAFNDVADVDLRAGHLHGLDNAFEEFARGAYKGPAAAIFFHSRSLSQEEQARPGIALTEDDMGAFAPECTPPAIAQISLDMVEAVAAGLGRRFRPARQHLQAFRRTVES
jgi:hypothetical protein